VNKNIYLLRHGKVSGAAALYGHTDVMVDDAINRNIVDNLFQQNLAIEHIYSSPLTRCLSLAKAVEAELALNKKLKHKAELVVIDDLQEMNFGLYDGIAFDELHLDQNIWQQLELFWQDPANQTLPNAEQLTNFNQRIIDAWKVIVNHKGDDNLLVVCHGGVIRMILADILNIDISNPCWYSQLNISYGSLTTLKVSNENAVVKQISQPLLVESN